MTSNPFTLIPASVRLVIYVVFAFIGLALGGVQVGYASAGIVDPTWLHIALAVLAFVGGPLGVTAASNIGNGPKPPAFGNVYVNQAPAPAQTVNPTTTTPTLADTAAPVVPPTTPPAA